MPPALQFLVLTFAVWVNRHQDDLIEYLREENRVLREHLGRHRVIEVVRGDLTQQLPKNRQLQWQIVRSS